MTSLKGQRYYGYLILAIALLAVAGQLPGRERLDNQTAAFAHIAPGYVHAVNGCSGVTFTVAISAAVTDANAFSLQYYVESSKLALISVTPGTDPALQLMPYALRHDTLFLDGFFHPNTTSPNVRLATLTLQAIAVGDVSTLLGFVRGLGLGGTGSPPDTMVFDGDTTWIDIEGTAPRPPDTLLIVPLAAPATNDSIRLQWKRVTRDLSGDPVINPVYTVYLEDVLNDTTYQVAQLTDTLYYDDYVQYTFGMNQLPVDTHVVNIGIYHVTACKTRP
jgi:hypothetical protein